MSKTKSTNVEVPTFINPHLFWILLVEDIKKRQEFEADLQKHVKHPRNLKKAQIGQTVLVFEQIWKRARVKELANFSYECWLIDYGVFHHYEKVYEIPEKYNNKPMFIKQAALDGVVNIQKSFGVSGISTTHTKEFCPGTIKCAREKITEAKRLFFKCITEKDGIHFGKLGILSHVGKIYSLDSALVEDGLLAVNEDLFPKALEENLEDSEVSNFLSFIRTNCSPCTKMQTKSNGSILTDFVVEDIAESKGVGRGTVRNTRLKEARITPGKQSLVEDWLETATPKEVNYESDDSENTTNLLKSPVISSPETPTTVSQDRFTRLKQTLIEKNKSEVKNISASSVNSDAPKRRSSEFNPLECLNRLKLDSTRSDVSSISAGKSESDISESSPKKDSENASDTVSINKNYLALLEKKFSSKPKDMDVSSVKSVPAIKYCDETPKRKHVDIMPAGMTVAPAVKKGASPAVKKEASPAVKKEASIWGQYSEGAPNKTQLNVIPAGMTIACAKKKETSKQRMSDPTPLKKVSSKDRDSTGSAPSRPTSTSSSISSIPNRNEFPRGLMQTDSIENVKKHHYTRGCVCVHCNNFGDEGQPDHDEFVDAAPQKTKAKTIANTKPNLLLKKEKDKVELVKIFNQSHMTNPESAFASKIMLHGTTVPSAISSRSTIPFTTSIHRSLRLFDQLFTIQSFATPCVMRRNNICIVNGAKSGKTLSYLPAMCSFLLDGDRYDQLPTNTISPILVILCPGVEVANKVKTLLGKLLHNVPNSPTSAFAVPPVDKKCLNQFQGQNDILITTPLVLISLVRTKIITVKRVCHLVIESGDTILEKFPKEIDSILKLMQSMLENRNCSTTIQMIVTAQHWTFQLENLMKELSITPMICIGSYLEAALYGRVDIQMHFLEAKNKRQALLDLLEDESNVCKTLVMCNNDTEIDEAKQFLNSSGISTVFMYNDMEKDEIMEMVTKWNTTIGGKHFTLLCTDQVYNTHLCISKAVLLVHYSLPESWTPFANRFSSLIDNYISPLNTETPKLWVRCKVHIFVDESCTQQYPKLVQFLQRMGAQLSPKFINYYQKSIKEREERKLASKTRLCKNLQLFGKCSSDNRRLYEASENSEVSFSSLNCKKRHILSAENDYSSNLPKCGIIQFKIISIQDVTRFTVKILENTDPDGTVHKWETYENMQGELNEAMLTQKVSVFNVEVDKWYVWYSENDLTYHRCTIQTILAFARITKVASLVMIRLLDSGIRKEAYCSSLYEMPNQFKDIPPQGVDIILANTVPPDLDENWSSHSKNKVKNILTEANYQNKEVYCISQIVLQLEDVIWVKNIHLREKLTTIDTIVTKLNLRKSLKENNLVSYSEEPLEKLYALCRNTGIDLPDFNKLPSLGNELENKPKQVEPQWAFIEDCDCNEIYICCVFTPALFYVRLKKFYDLLENLQKDIQEIILKPFYPKESEIEVGKYYLAKDFGGDDYCRVKVTEIKENIASCYYVDFGDCASVNVADIKHLTDEFIVKLPFQAIECRLYGVQPAWGGNGWEDTAINLLDDYIFEPKTDYYRTLYTTNCKEEPATTTGGKKFAILLVDNFKRNKIILLNQLLIDCGEAVNIEGEDLDQQFNVYDPNEEPDIIDVDDEVVGKGLTIEEVRRLSDKYNNDDNVINNNDQLPTDTNKCEAGVDEDSEHSWDIVINDPEKFLKQLLGVATVDKVPASTSEPTLSPMTALPHCDHSTPSVVWFQTDQLVSFNVMLPDLKEFVLKVTRNRMVMFKTVHQEKDYILELQLYDKVMKEFEYKIYGQYLKVLLNKCTPIEWPRLIFSAERMRHIRYDMSRIVIPEEVRKTFLKISGEDDEDCGNGYEEIVVGSDEDDSESDIESIASMN